MIELEDDILLRYLQKECSDVELQQINDWLDESAENVSYLFTLEEMFDSGKMIHHSEKRNLDKAEVRLKKSIELSGKRSVFQLRARAILRYAALFLLLLSVGGLTYKLIHNKIGYQVQDELIFASSTSVKEVLLPDGTKVWLNKESSIKYPKSFKSDLREVFLNGEAYFEVSKDEKKPFIVQTEAIQVKVLGTVFNLRCQPGDLVAEATLIEGSVQVKVKDGEGLITLSPGQKTFLDRSTGILQVKQVNAKLDAVWRNDMIPFEHASLTEIAKTLEQFYQIKIILDPNIDSYTYSGVVHRRETIDSVLNSLKNSIPISYVIDKEKVYLNKAE